MRERRCERGDRDGVENLETGKKLFPKTGPEGGRLKKSSGGGGLFRFQLRSRSTPTKNWRLGNGKKMRHCHQARLDVQSRSSSSLSS